VEGDTGSFAVSVVRRTRAGLGVRIPEKNPLYQNKEVLGTSPSL